MKIRIFPAEVKLPQAAYISSPIQSPTNYKFSFVVNRAKPHSNSP